MINFIFFVFFASVFGFGISLFQYNIGISPIVYLTMIAVGTIGMLITIKRFLKELKYGSEVPYFMLCRKCIWSEPIIKSNKIKGYICKKNPFNHVIMGLNDKHTDRKFKNKRAK